MASIRVIVTLVLALTLGLALPVAALPLSGTDLLTGVFGGSPFVEQLCESLLRSLCSRRIVGGEERELAGANTALGDGALESNTTGIDNTAVGVDALESNTTGSSNTAVGVDALQINTTGDDNTALGSAALSDNTTGSGNTAVGGGALPANTTGNNNTALGGFALENNTTGGNNTALGFLAGLSVTTGNNNIHIGNQGTDGDTALIRIGTVGTHTATFIAGIAGQTSPSGLAVLVNGAGHLGTTTSSRRAKDEIRDMGVASDGVLKLRPVTFRYKPEHDDGARLAQYGLIAEEVAEIFPELVVLDKDGQPSGVRYHVLPAMLLNELQRQQREIVELRAKVQELDELRAQVRALIGGRAAIRE
jgi:hypothetical protein